MIEVEALTKSYGDVAALRDVSFRVERGEVIGFLGPNGAGKTTTMRILTCFMPATSGTARVDGIDCAQDPLEVRRRMGYLPESNPLYPELTARRFLDFVARAKAIPAGKRGEEIERVMSLCGIGGVAERIVGHLSKGYRQRVGLAQALIGDPPILVLDEPTIGLDPTQIIEIRTLIKQLAGERTILLSSHILPEVSQVCQRVIIINRGGILATDTPENLVNRMGRGGKLQVRASGPDEEIRGAIAAVPGVKSVVAGGGLYRVEGETDSDLRAEVARAVVGGGWDLLELRAGDVSLEDVFLHLVTDEQEAA
jgi:ABC-2 type transport system ATP-binding protein